MNTQITQNPNIYQSNARFPQVQEDEVDLRELFSVIWKGKRLIIAITTTFAIASIGLALYLPNIYKSEALLAPASEEQGGGLSALASQFGGLASLAGLNLNAKGGTDKTQLAIEVLKSRQFTSEFIQRHNILAELMAAKKWDLNNDKLIYDEDDYIEESNTWVRDVKPPIKPEPSMQEAYKEFSKILSVNSDKETAMVTISISHLSPNIAQQWVTWLVQDINKVMRDRDVAEAHRSTEFLNQQIALTNVADIKTVLYKLIEEQAKTIMFAEVRDEYVFKTIDPAFVPEEKAKPKRALICVLGAMLGGVLGMILVLVRHFIKKRL
ncbi:LPS O-antigen length regulator [Shewanella sp. FJAT-51649]|uniref:Wzz/FepE/Etk N-terminal domain-containing protein n=1 Tax=Shewanella sp. FJAT-51649 TaxID=2864210 RepID=UPI001C65DCDB|nr:Wzz/FepE/Etk N-terminal domain-containing protein [Shewanella sp. FJAT-51649]QYJ72791.1 LPS O-antigen length regulator [Shewanella sp. FJAT-51649]